jgi:putative intracellular protease/amidase
MPCPATRILSFSMVMEGGGMSKIAWLYVFEGMADWEYGYLIAELNSGRYFTDRGSKLEVRAVAASPGPIRSMGALRILPDALLEELEPDSCALLILPGGDSWLEAVHAPVLEKARALLDAGILVAAICGATIALAQAGLLDDREHTSNDLGYLKAVCPSYRGEALYRNEASVLDKGLITASGVAPVEFAHLVLRSLGSFSRDALEGWLGLYRSHEPKYYFQLMNAVAK